MPKTLTKTIDPLLDVILGPVTLDLPPLVEEEPNQKIIELEEVLTKIETDEDYFPIYKKKLEGYLKDNDFKYLSVKDYFWRERDGKTEYIFLDNLKEKEGTHIFSIDKENREEFMKYVNSEVNIHEPWGFLSGMLLGGFGGFGLGLLVGVNVAEYTLNSGYATLSMIGTWISFGAASIFSGISLDNHIYKKRKQKYEKQLKQHKETFNPYLKHSPDKYNFKLIKSFLDYSTPLSTKS